MKKKLLIASLLAILTILGISYSFAAETTENNNSNSKEVNLGNTITESMNKTGNTAENVIEDVTGNRNTIDNMKNSMSNTMSDMTNGIKGAAGATRNTVMNVADYTTSRVQATAEDATTSMSGSTWTWIIIAMVAIAIVGLVWFYAVQNTDEK